MQPTVQPPTTKPAVTYNDIFEQTHGVLPPERVTFKESSADILSPGRGFMESFDWTMQLQVGCPAGCLFCYVSASFRMAPPDVQRNWGFEVRDKKSVAARLEKHLLAGSLADCTVYWSGVTDPYGASPKITREIWEAFLKADPSLRPRRIVVQTRMGVARDVELLQEYAATTPTTDGGPAVVVSYSVGTDREDLIRAWERRTPSFASRLRTISKLRQAGIWVVPTLSPFGLWNDLAGTLQSFRSLEIPYVTALFFKHRTGATTTPKSFLQYLAVNYPELLDDAWQEERVAEMESVMGPKSVLIGKPGFESLAAPHKVIS